MKNKKLILFASILMTLVLVSLLITAGCKTTPEQVFHLKMQSQWPRGDISMEHLSYFADSCKQKSNGRLLVDVYAEPEIVPMEQVVDATIAGAIDIMHGGGAVTGAIAPVSYIEFGIPYSYKIVEANGDCHQAAAIIHNFFFKDGFIDLLRDTFANLGLYYVDIHCYGWVPFLMSTKPIVNYEDFRGLKIRSEGAFTEWQKLQGAIGTADIGPGDTYMALKTGTLDAAQWDVSAVTGLKWNEVAPYWVKGYESDHAVGHIMVNMNVWNSLPDDLKQVIKDSAAEYFDICLDAYCSEEQTILDMVDSGQLKVSELTPECQTRLAEDAFTVWDELAQQDETSAKAIEMFKAWRGPYFFGGA
jgi:TRAP-type mannitol/chloroaromatic compound transport system substrate-binding protein